MSCPPVAGQREHRLEAPELLYGRLLASAAAGGEPVEARFRLADGRAQRLPLHKWLAPVDAADRVVLAGVRDLDSAEREALERSDVTVIGASPVETLVAVKNALDGAPVYVHLDLDVLDPEDFPAQFPAPGGLGPEKLYDLLEAVTDTSEVIGFEVTAFAASEDELERAVEASTALHVLEPLLDSVPEEVNVGD